MAKVVPVGEMATPLKEGEDVTRAARARREVCGVATFRNGFIALLSQMATLPSTALDTNVLPLDD
jgi:hypothetical protein